VANGVLYVTGASNSLTAFALSTSPPAFTSANGATFQVGVARSFTVTAAGTPTPTLSEIGPVTPPSGVTFSAASGLLAGTPAPTAVGSYALQFKATNGVQPDATQNFTLIVNPASAGPAILNYTGAPCASFVLSGTPPAQTITCAGSNPAPVCTPTANPSRPAAGQSTTISAGCINQPTAYLWTGGKCAGVAAATCTVTRTLAGSVTYTVTATNAGGASVPASITVTWH
jgi:hypothetical protein